MNKVTTDGISDGTVVNKIEVGRTGSKENDVMSRFDKLHINNEKSFGNQCPSECISLFQASVIISFVSNPR